MSISSKSLENRAKRKPLAPFYRRDPVKYRAVN